jgi:anion-transporting  ArsA/GET3 family ATPase
MPFLNDCLNNRVLFFTGKGGVGKSSVAWATAKLCAKNGKRVTVASWSPFTSQSESALEKIYSIQSIQLDTLSAFREYALKILKFDKIYDAVFDNHVLKTFIRAAPGLSETVIAGKIWDLYTHGEQDILIVDLPASGHAFSFFQSPLGIQKVFSKGFVHREAEKVCEMFQANDCRIDLVTLPEEMPIVESIQFHEKLMNLYPFHFGFLHVNQCTPDFPIPEHSFFQNLPREVQECEERHISRKAQETEALEAAEKLPLKQLHIPRFTSETVIATQEKLFQFLETR